MKFILAATLGVLLTTFSVQAIAQATLTPLTNADVIRFVAMGLPDEAVKNLISDAIEANVTRFDLSPAAISDLAGHGVSAGVVAAMRQPPAPPAVIDRTPPPSSTTTPTRAGPPNSYCSPAGAADLRKLGNSLRASNADDSAFIQALDNAVLPGVNLVSSLAMISPGVVTISFMDALSIFAVSPYGQYRTGLTEALRKRERIEGAEIPAGVQIAVSPSQIAAPDIIKIMVERDGKEVTQLANMLKLTELTTRMGAKEVIHSGFVLYPCSAFAAGATVTVTAIPRVGNNITKTISPETLAALK